MSQYPPNPYGQNPNDPNYVPGTSYGAPPPPPGVPNPYGTYPTPAPNPPSGPGSGPGQYGAYTPPPPGPSTDPTYNPYDPYAQTVANQPPNTNYTAYAPPPVAPPPIPQAPQRRRGSTGTIIIAVIALVIIIGGGIFGFLAYNNVQTTNNNNATATAQANAAATSHANATATANAALTATAIASTYPFSNKQVLNDPLSDNTKGNNWETNSLCQFTGNAYHVSDSSTNTFGTCFGVNTNFNNFTFEAEMNISSGDGGGLLFRGNSQTTQLYRVTFYTDGNYGVYVYRDATGSNASVLKYAPTPMTVDLTNTNTVAVVARGSTISVYLNQTLVVSIQDSTYSSGQIGFNAYDTTNATDVIFSNAKVWQL